MYLWLPEELTVDQAGFEHNRDQLFSASQMLGLKAVPPYPALQVLL